MSVCVSQHGEYSEHEPDATFTCRLCGVVDVDALLAQLEKTRTAVGVLARTFVSMTNEARAMVGPNELVAEDGSGDWLALWARLGQLAAVGRAHSGDRLRALQLHDEGLTVRAIADQIDRAPSTVHMWIQDAEHVRASVGGGS